MPFSTQAKHQRDLEKAGISHRFGSFKYTAKSWYDKKILVSLDNYSPRQFDKIEFVISSNQPGVFILEVYNKLVGVSERVASQELRMEELLDEKFENQPSITLFNGLARVNLKTFLYQINKKYVIEFFFAIPQDWI